MMLKFIVVCLVLLNFFFGCQTPTSSQSSELSAAKSYEVISIPAKDTELRAHIFSPKGQGPFPAVVALHGCAGLLNAKNEMRPRDLEWGQRLAEWGFVVIYPDSFTTRGLKQICQGDPKSMPQTVRPGDAYAALKWLHGQSNILKDKIVLMGWSNGGSSLLWTIDERSTMRENDFKTAIAFYPGCRLANQDQGWVNRIPTEILMGEKDDWTNPKFCESMVQRASKKSQIKITVYPDSFHDFDAPNMPPQRVHNLAYVVGGDRSATIGTYEKARSAAIEKVRSILQRFN